jgi:hypothetical protein
MIRLPVLYNFCTTLIFFLKNKIKLTIIYVRLICKKRDSIISFKKKKKKLLELDKSYIKVVNISYLTLKYQ